MSTFDPARWIVCPRPRPEAVLRLYCLPYAGAGASAYVRWHLELPEEVEICPLQLPGRENRYREPAVTEMAEMVSTLQCVLRSHVDRPYVIFGHSLGALVALELSRALQSSEDRSPLALIVSGRRPPQLPDPEADWGALSSLSDELLIQEIGRRYQPLPEPILRDPHMRAFYLRVLRADLAVLDGYVHRVAPPLACPIIALGGRDDKNIEGLEQWQTHSRCPLQTHILPGGHFFLQSARTELLALLSKLLGQLGHHLRTGPRE